MMFDGFVAPKAKGGLGRRLLAAAVAIGMHAALAAWLLVSPTVSEAVPETDVPVVFYRAAPAPPPPPPPPKVRRHRKKKKPTKPTVMVQPKIEQIKPVERKPEPEPEPEIEPEPEFEEEDDGDDEIEGVEGGVIGGVEGGVVGGVVGGQVGGVLGGVLGGELGGEPIRLKKGMIPPKKLPGACPDPEYPRMLREARISGRVVLLVAVKQDGTVGEVKVRSGNEALAHAAVRAVKQCRFRPAKFEGKAVYVWLPVPYVFKLE